MGNHANEDDPWVIGSLSGGPLRFMANIDGVAPWKAGFAELLGAYGRRKGGPDIGALRRTLELVGQGDAVGLFPEGDRSWDGASETLRPGAARLLKRLDVPLVLAVQRGNYLARPRWAFHGRRGRWSVDFRVFDAAEIGRLSEPLLDAIIAGALARNEVKDALAEGRIFEGRGLAEGVERLLWRCPICGATDRVEGFGDSIRCLACGSAWSLDANLRVVPSNLAARGREDLRDLKDWEDWQTGTLPGLVAGGKGISTEGVELFERQGSALRSLGRGLLRLAGGELRFEQGADRLVFEAAELRGLVDNFNSFAEFSYRGMRWRLRMGGGNVLKYIRALAAADKSVCATAPGTEGVAA
jgi:1-acyl-sn-glycerol-3-phosphate acyltransferase